MTALESGTAARPPRLASIHGLPNELLQHVLLYVPPLSIIAFEQVCRRFANVVGSYNWRSLCYTQFRYWDRRHDISAKFEDRGTNIDWKRIYVERHRSHRETSRLLDGILSTQVGRIDKFQKIIDIGYDAKDCLLEQLAVDDGAGDVLARRYYADAALGSLHRAMAVREWSRLREREVVPLEHALTAFDMFVLHKGNGDFSETTVRLDAIAAEVLVHYPNFHESTTRARARMIATYLLQHQRLGLRDNGIYHYHDLQNNFIGFTLYEDEHASIPLICVAIYCCVAKRLGLDASLCALPFHIVATLRPEAGYDCDGRSLSNEDAAEPIYMDPFTTDEDVPLCNLLSRLTLIGVPQAEQRAFLEPASVPDLIIRTGRNVLFSVQESQRRITTQQIHRHAGLASSPLLDFDGAFYGALWACLLFGTSPNGTGPHSISIRPRAYLPPFMEHFETHFPTDVGLIESHILPIFSRYPEAAQLRESIRVVRCVDSMPKLVRRRDDHTTERVRYKVGQVFQHKRYNYFAVITGWDPECSANERWKAQMRIDELSQGAGQSFYHALVEDKSVRYVAEENIRIVKPVTPYGLIHLAGKHFKRWDRESRCFVSNIRDEYPND